MLIVMHVRAVRPPSPPQNGPKRTKNEPFPYYKTLYYSYTEVEKDTITMVLYHLLASSHLPDEVKSRIRVAAGLGRKDHCQIFSCELNLREPSLS